MAAGFVDVLLAPRVRRGRRRRLALPFRYYGTAITDGVDVAACAGLFSPAMVLTVGGCALFERRDVRPVNGGRRPDGRRHAAVADQIAVGTIVTGSVSASLGSGTLSSEHAVLRRRLDLLRVDSLG